MGSFWVDGVFESAQRRGTGRRGLGIDSAQAKALEKSILEPVAASQRDARATEQARVRPASAP
ncbi:MAG: hypothetical protein ACLFUJ_04610 [Phycisphaerae bacterium]